MEDIIDDGDYVASEHDRLVSAISKLDKTQHISEPTRNEPTTLNSEFNLIKKSKKLDLSNVVKVLGETAHNVQIGKKLKKSQEVSAVLPKPLEKPQVERIKRSTGYEEAKKKVGRWDPVVARSRTVDFVSFPLKNVTTKLQPTQEFISKFELKSELERELEEIDPPVQIEEEDEEEKLYPMTYQEMIEQRQHLAKMRAQQSYKAAKAKRQSKIKSKKYHRVLKKEKLKAQLKEFEELQKKDPEEALKKLEALEKARALERHTLRHKNTGKWAKSKLVRAKYDKEVRQELAEQLAVSRALTQKTKDDDTSDDEPDTSETIADIHLSQDPMNPWMLKRSDKSNVDQEFDFGYKKYVQGKTSNKDESDSEENDESDVFDKIKDKLSNINKVVDSNGEVSDDDKTQQEQNMEDCSEEVNKAKRRHSEIINISEKEDNEVVIPTKKNRKLPKTATKKNKSDNINFIATTNWIVESIEDADQVDVSKTRPAKDVLTAFDSFENDVTGKVEKKLQKLRRDIKRLEKSKVVTKEKRPKKEFDNLEYLKMKNQKVKAIIDEELFETAGKDTESTKYLVKPLLEILKTTESAAKSDTDKTAQEKTDTDIDPSRFIEVKPKYLNTALPGGDNDYDILDDDEQVVPKVNIEEVFEEDDVVASFRQEKEDEKSKDKPEDIDLSLPGWGSWGGKGVKPARRRRNRFILKAPPQMPRRDENKGDIIIKEYKDPKLQIHKVTDVPFPFTSVKDYEASIRAPLGNTFVPENAHRKLINPSVITKAGTIIEPMDEDELLVKRNRNFKNEKVIKLLGQK